MIGEFASTAAVAAVVALPLFQMETGHFEAWQRRYVQRNDWWDRIAPVEVLAREVGIQRAGRRQSGSWS